MPTEKQIACRRAKSNRESNALLKEWKLTILVSAFSAIRWIGR
jgi:hypothetical protein